MVKNHFSCQGAWKILATIYSISYSITMRVCSGLSYFIPIIVVCVFIPIIVICWVTQYPWRLPKESIRKSQAASNHNKAQRGDSGSNYWCTESDRKKKMYNYSDAIMGAMVSQITSLTIVYSTVYSSVNQRRHESSASLAFVRGEFPAQMASSAENVSTWWRHHAAIMYIDCRPLCCTSSSLPPY